MGLILKNINFKYAFKETKKQFTRFFSFTGSCSIKKHESADPTLPKSEENKLLHHLRSKIRATGPITVAEYMRESLTNPVWGYYMKKDVLGTSGDFITSPEISQMFGEMIAVWFLNEWMKVGKPMPLQIVELGPGRGTLMDDILRVFSQFPTILEVISVHLVEISPHLSVLQEQKLCLSDCSPDGDGRTEDIDDSLEEKHYKSSTTKYRSPIFWYHHIKSVPKGFSFFIAHEFFDALPIHKFEKTAKGWREVLIDVDDDPEKRQLRYVIAQIPTPASKMFIDEADTRSHCEISPESGLIMEELCIRMKEDGGFTLIADYGHDGTKTDTFRSFYKHGQQDPLHQPGSADLTADVDFSYLKRVVKDKAVIFGPLEQEKFLTNVGIEVRLQKLLESAKPEMQKEIKSGYDMLMKPDEMGDKFKFLGLFPTVLKDYLERYPPAGFQFSSILNSSN